MGLSAEERSIVLSGAARLAVSLDDRALAGLGRFLDLLELWNQRINLVGERDRRRLLQRHVTDSLAAVPLVHSEGDEPRVADVGSGGGLPGVPVALACAGARVTLVEPRHKRVSFLREVARDCSTWNIDIEARRVDEMVRHRSARFDVVLSRATFPPDDLPRRAGALVRPGGLLLGFTTARTPARPGPFADFAAPRVHPYDLPAHGGPLTLTSWRRSTDPLAKG